MKIASEIINIIQNVTYHKEDMKLKPENTSKPWTYLEGIISIKNQNEIVLKFNNKNMNTCAKREI